MKKVYELTERETVNNQYYLVLCFESTTTIKVIEIEIFRKIIYLHVMMDVWLYFVCINVSVENNTDRTRKNIGLEITLRKKRIENQLFPLPPSPKTKQ